MEELLKILDKKKIKHNKEKIKKIYQYMQKIYGDNINYNQHKVIDHCIETTIIVSKIGMDKNSIYASLLHDVLNFGATEEEVKELFGKDILNLIEGVNRLSYLNYSRSEQLDLDMLKKMFLAIASDLRVVVIKLCDRLVNMRRHKYMEEKVRQIKSKESLEIYASIASRLGISSIKSELEDISFMCLHREEYDYIKNKIELKRVEREEYIKSKIEDIKKKLDKENIEYRIYGRPKHFYSIYKKMKEKKKDIYDIYDLLAIRIIVKSIKDCYTTLGIIHSMYKPMPGRFKDYIAVPKTNNYQSLHTTVFGKKLKNFEVQIRTEDMHMYAEYGAAAHFIYKEKIDNIEDKMLWIRKTLDFAKETVDVKKLKGEIFGEEVFVFTPKGEIKSLPKGSTIIDFAYNVHQKVAETMTGAKINGSVAPIFTKLKNTDVVEIITSNNAKGPTMDWLKHVKSTSSKNKITSYLKKQGFEDNVARGKLLFEKEVKKQKINKDELLKEKYLNEMVESLKSKNLDHVYENIGFGNLSSVKVINRLVNVYYKYNKKEIEPIESIIKSKSRKVGKDYILVEGLTNCLVKLAKCCSPIPGDEIVGYITNANGVTVHRKDCNNIIPGMQAVNVKWKIENKDSFETKIKIMSNNREGITVDIINKLNELKAKMTGLKANVNSQKFLSIILSLSVENIDDANKVIREIKKIESVFEVKRQK